MSRIDELIQQLCPDGVEYKPLGEIFDTRNGYTPSTRNKQLWENGTVPWFRMEDIRIHGRILHDSLLHISFEAVKGGRLFPANSLLVATSATIGEHALITVPHLSNQRFTSLALKMEYADRLNIRFLYYYCFHLDKWCKNNITRSSFASVDMSGLKKFMFPLPPLPVQEEIVRILDKFTALEAELEAELEARRKQYEYYRDQLLTFGDEVEWKPLKDIAFYSSEKVSASILTAQNYIGVDNLLPNKMGKTKSDYVPTNGNFIKFSINDILIGNIRPYLKKIWLATHDGGTNGDVLVISIAPEYKLQIIPDFLYYLLSSDDFFYYDMRHAKGAKMPRGNKNIIMEYQVPVPPLAEQERIVAILDKFDALVNDISSGLPAELEMRRKQYEYYRDKLLTFKPIAKEA